MATEVVVAMSEEEEAGTEEAAARVVGPPTDWVASEGEEGEEEGRGIPREIDGERGLGR